MQGPFELQVGTEGDRAGRCQALRGREVRCRLSPCPEDEVWLRLDLLHGVDGGVDEDPGRITEVITPGARVVHRPGAS